MNTLTTMLRRLIILLCAALFLAGAVWNLCFPSENQNDTGAAAEQPEESVEVLFLPEERDTVQTEETAIASRIAALRMERDASWQQLYHAVEELEFADKQNKLQQYAELQYKEQRLELLLSAKGMEDCLAVLDQNQANIIVPAEVLQNEYEKLYDLVLRNTDYAETEIILVPLQ